MISGKNTLIFRGLRGISSVLNEKVLSSQTNFYEQMADLKEETTVDNTNQVEERAERPNTTIDPSLEGIQLYYEKNKKVITYVGGGLLVLIAAFVYYKLFYIPELEKEASNEIFWAESYFEKDSFNLALKGGNMVFSADGQKPMMGFEQVADQYSMTKTGNLANYYAGICYLRTGKFEQAIEFLSKFDGDDDVVGPLALGAIGDCHLEMKRADEALKYYMKAADKKDNSFTRPYFLKKSAFAQEQLGNFNEAADLCERIKKEHPRAAESQEIDKEITRLRTMAGN
jgi:tetratricopeptide (TPR) repeat protein